MKQAFLEAFRSKGITGKNPNVGCVIVKDNQIIGKIQPFGYMDDITIATYIMATYPYVRNENGTNILIPKYIH